MRTPLLTGGCLLAALLVLPGRAADPPKPAEPTVPELSMEVQALKAIYNLKLNDEQLRLLARLAGETSERARDRGKPEVSDEYRQVLLKLRDALADDKDEDTVADLEDELAELDDKQKPEIDDGFDITKAARQRVPEVLKSLKPSQLAAYYGGIADDVTDPLDRLTTALTSVRGFEKAEWRDQRDALAEQLAWALAGADAAKAERVNDKVVSLLSKARSLTAEEFKAQFPELEKAAKEIVGDVGPDAVLRHDAERTLADLLSNPRLAAAVKGRLK